MVGPGLDSVAVEAQQSKKAELEEVLAAATEKRAKKFIKYRFVSLGLFVFPVWFVQAFLLVVGIPT